MDQIIRKPSHLSGSLAVPGDKSISHRSLILNAIANGTATISGLSDGGDVRSTAACLQAMGVSIEPLGEPGSFRVGGLGASLQEPSDMLDAGNSGTSMRLLSGLLAGQDFLAVLTGDGSLRTRPMGPRRATAAKDGRLHHGPPRRYLGSPGDPRWISQIH